MDCYPLIICKGQSCGFVLLFLSQPPREPADGLTKQEEVWLSARSGQGAWQAPRSCALSGETLKAFITTGGGEKAY